MGILAGILPWLGKAEEFLGSHKNLLGVLGGIATNRANQDRTNTVAQNMEQMILTGKKYGIHPLEAIGGNVSGGVTIPLQNPLASIQQAEPVDVLKQQTAKLIYEDLKAQAQDRKYKYSLLVPVSAKPGGKRILWGLNPHYFGYGMVQSGIMAAANGMSFKEWAESLNPTEKKELDKTLKKNERLLKNIPDELLGVGGM